MVIIKTLLAIYLYYLYLKFYFKLLIQFVNILYCILPEKILNPINSIIF